MWAIEHSGIVPDMLTWGKGMGGDMPMAGLTFKKEIGKTLVEGSQPGTFAGNALACAVSMTNIDLITDKKMDLLGRATRLGKKFGSNLSKQGKVLNALEMYGEEV